MIKERNYALKNGIEGLPSAGERMYVGSLDDSVSRYTWGGFVPDVSYLNNLILENALLGTKLCSRIGNILYHDEYLKALLNPNDSPLLDFARAGFLQLQMRQPTINETIESRQVEGTNSTLSFIQKYGWKKGSSIHRNLQEIDSILSPEKGKTVYIPEFKKYFRFLMDQNTASSNREFLKVYNIWKQRDVKARTRSNFEEDAKICFIDDLKHGNQNRIKLAMWVANSANHFAYGLGMAEVGKNANILIETSEINEHVELCSKNEKICLAQRDEILAKQQTILKTLHKYLFIPEEIKSPEHWGKLAKLVDSENEGSGAASGFLHRKTILLTMLSLYLTQPEKFDEADLRKSCIEYSKALCEGVGLKRVNGIPLNARILLCDLKTRAAKVVEHAAYGAAADMASGGLSLGTGTCIGIAVGLVDPNASHKILRRLKTKDIINEESDQKVNILDIKNLHRAGETSAVRTISPIKMASIQQEFEATKS